MILALRRQGQVDRWGFKANLIYLKILLLIKAH